MHNRRPLPLLFFLFCLVTTLSPLNAAANLSPPQQIIQNSSDRIQQTLSQPLYRNDFARATQFVDGVVGDFVDMERVAILVLGRHIRQTTPAQRQQFIKEFRTLLVRTYTKAFLEYTDWHITFLPQVSGEDPARTIVRTTVHQPGQQPINIHYRMMKNRSGEWKVFDILIEGVSLVTNYRSTFNREIAQTGSIDGVIKMLVDRNRR